MKKLLLFTLLFTQVFLCQTITWNEITSNYQLPEGIKIFEGSRTSPSLKLYYLDVDLNNSLLAIRPYLAASSMTLPTFTAKVGAYAAINGGFFGGTTSYSAVVYPNEIKAVNVPSLLRNGLIYPVIRSFFGMKKDHSLTVNWIYQFGNTLHDLYSFMQPLPYTANDPNPKPVPQKSDGTELTDILTGIGGAPTLVKNGIETITYNEEIMWGSGVGETNDDPRTAVGYTNNKHVIMLTADGRQATSSGVSLSFLAQTMLSLGCIEAINLDGGGSTQMAVPNAYINHPSEQRAVPTILAVVHNDSLNLPTTPLFEKIIDTEDTSVTSVGGGWFESSNSGFWGSSKSQLHAIGTETAYYEYRLHLPAEAKYNIYGWWVSSSNRCKDTPFIFERKGGKDSVWIDQTANGSTWTLIGTFTFNGNDDDRVLISDAGTTGSYVVADAIKIESFDSSVVSDVHNLNEKLLPTDCSLSQNYPNPFNPSTIISYQLSVSSNVTLKIYDILGKEVATLVDEEQQTGNHFVTFNTANYSQSAGNKLTSGIYYYRLQAGGQFHTRGMILVK